jgi:orotate phosphoribosyltransferase
MLLTSFPNKEVIAELTAKMLIEVEAVRFSADEPFKFTSGWHSPVYIDCRKLISYPRVRHTLMDFATSVIMKNIGFESIDSVCGGETAGIPFAAWISERLMLPMQYVRKKSKGFGRNAQIEGDFTDGANILLVEDLTTDGNSKIKFCEALRAAGANVDHTFVVFYYDIFPHTRDSLDRIGLEMHSLATWWDVLKVAKDFNYFSIEAINEVEKFLNHPMEWSAAHGGASSLSE